MIVNNTTFVDKEKAFQTLVRTGKKNIYTKYIFAFIMLIIGVILLVFGIILNESLYSTCGSLFAAFGVAYIIVNIINIIKLPKKIIANNKEICENGITYNYKFKEQSIYVECKTLNRTAKATYNYKDLKKVYEYDDLYELVFDGYEVLYVLKNGFENERMIEFFIKNLTINKKKIKNRMKEV